MFHAARVPLVPTPGVGAGNGPVLNDGVNGCLGNPRHLQYDYFLHYGVRRMAPRSDCKLESKTLSRRGFLGAGVAGAAGAALAWPGLSGELSAVDSPQGVCVVVCNHWSYTGIGWQLGIESCVLSVTDAMEMADRPPHVKTCINLDARAYEFMAEKFPEVAARLKKYLAAGKVELIGGTYGQPMGTMFSGESNIRQIVVGRETIRKALGYEMVTFLEEEEFTHPQVPQIVAGAGFRYASLAQLDTWGRAGCPVLEFNAIRWKGHRRHGHSDDPQELLVRLLARPEATCRLAGIQEAPGPGQTVDFHLGGIRLGVAGAARLSHHPGQVPGVCREVPVEFVTCKEYLDKYGSNPKETIYLPMDAWNKSLTWGLGGDQLRIMDRKVEAVLLAAERFDAIASALGGAVAGGALKRPGKTCWPRRATTWDCANIPAGRATGWRRWTASRTITTSPGARSATTFSTPPRKQGQAALDASLAQIIKRIDSASGKRGARAVTVLNPSGWDRSDVVLTGRIYPMPEKAADMVVKDRAGRVVPSQIVKADRDPQGNLMVASVAFAAEKVPGVGYDTYYLEFTPEAAAAAPSALAGRQPEPDAGERARQSPARPDQRRHEQPDRQALGP